MAAILPPSLASAEAAGPAAAPRNTVTLAGAPDWRPEALALTARAAVARDRKAAADLWAEAAALHAAHGSPEGIELAQRALAFTPGHGSATLVLVDDLLRRGERAEARSLLGAAWRANAHDERIADALEPLCDEAQDWATLDALLVAKVESGAAPERKSVLLRLARIRAARGDHAGQVGALEKLAADPQALDAAERARVWLGAAALRAGRLADPVGAFRCAIEAVRLQPADAATREACDSFVRGANAESELYAVLDAVAPTLDAAPGQERAVRLRAAGLAERDGRLRDHAERHYSRVLELAPSDPEALAGLTRLALGSSRWKDAAELLRVRADGASGAERAVLLEKRMEVLATRLRDAAGAAEACRAAIAAAPEEQRVRLTRRLAELCRDAGDREGALEALEAMPPAERDPRAIASALEELARDARDPAARASLELRLARVAERELGQAALAFAAITRAVRAAPSSIDARRELARISAAVGVPGEHARVLASIASDLEGDGAVELWREIAAARDAAGDRRGTAEAWEEVRRRAPADLAALSALANLYDAEESAPALASVLAALRAQGRAEPGMTSRLAELLLFGLDLPREALPLCAEVLAADERSTSARRVAVALASRPDAIGRKAIVLAERALARAPIADAAEAWEGIARGSGDVEAWRRSARLRHQLGDHGGARYAWRAVRSQLPADREAAVALDALLEPAAPAAERAAVAWHALPEGSPGRIAALPRCAKLAAEAGDAPRALAAWVEIAEARPADAEALAALEALAHAGDPELAGRACAALEAALRRTGDHRRLLRVLELRVEAAEGAARGAVLEELATLHERLGDEAAAARRWREAARSAPTVRSWGAVARAARRRGAWGEVVEAMTQVAQCAAGSRERTEAWCEVARLMDTKLGDREGALAGWRRALAENPDDAGALDEVARLLGDAERWGELVDVLARQAALADRRPSRAADGAELRLRAARIRQERMADADGAFKLYRDVLDRVPAHPAAVAALHALACAGSVEAALTVEPIHEQAGDWRRLAEVLEARARAADDRRARAALRVRVAKLHESSGEPARAFDAAAQALSDDPESPEALALAERLASGREDAFRELLAGCARRAERPEARLGLQRRLARETRAPRARAAAWSAVLELAPGDLEAIDGLVASHRAAGNAAGLADALRLRAASLRERPARLAALAELARVEEDRGDVAAAATALRGWLELEPESREALARLERVIDGGSSAEELAQVLTAEISLADRAGDVGGAAAFRFRLAEVRLERRGDRDGALDLLEEVLARDPGHEGALARLEAMLDAAPADVRVARALLAAHEAERRWEGVAAVLEVHAPELPGSDERKALLARLADIRERHLGNAELAFVALARAFREDPADVEIRAGLARLAAATGQEEELVSALEESLERVSGPVAADVLVALGTLHVERLGDPEGAIGWWMRAWRLDPERSAEVIPRLERLCGDAGRQAELAEIIEWRAAAQLGPARAELLDRAARVHAEQLGEPQRAVGLWREALAAQPGHLGALRSLAQIAEAEKRAGDVIALGEALVAAGLHHEASEAARRALALESLTGEELERIGALCSAAGARPERARASERRAGAHEQAGNAPAAAAAWRGAADDWEAIGHWDGAAAALEKALAIEGDDATFARVRALHARRGAWRDDARVCLEQSERVTDEAARAALLAAAARLQEQRLGERDLAFFSWCRVLTLSPASADAAAAAERLAAETSAWDDLGAVWEQVADGATGSARATALVALARVRERIGDAEGKRSALAEALRADPGAADALDQLTEHLARDGQWPEVIAALEAARDAAPAERAASLQRRIARITDEHLDDPEAALAAWREAQRRAPEDVEALDALERLCAALNRWEDLDGVLAERARRTAAPRERAAWLRRSAALRDERLDDVEGALRRAEEALALDPADGATLARLSRLYERAGRVADRARVLERQAAATTDLRERLTLLLAAGEAWTRLGDRAKAESAWREVLRIDPENPDSLAAVAELHEQARESSAALDALRRLAASPRAAGRAADAWFRIGKIQLARGDAAAAEEAWRRALDVDPGHLGAIRALRGAREAAGDRAAVTRLLEAEARSAPDPRERARAMTELGTFARRDRQDLETARRWFVDALAADPDQLDAARPLAEIHVARGEWDRAAPLLETIVERLPAETDRREAARWWHRLGLAAAQLGDDGRALACQRRARDLDGSSLPVLERLATLAEQAGALDDALAAHEAVLAHHRDGLTREERAGAYARIALLEERLGRPLRAIAALNEALTADPEQRAARERLVTLLEARGDFRDALNHRRRLADALPPTARAAALAEIAAVARDRLDDLPSAIEALEAAVRLVPAEVPLADALVSAYLLAGQSQRAGEVLARLLAQPAVRAAPRSASRIALALGRLLRDRARDPGGAARAFDDALELDPGFGEALAELEELLARDRQWRELERTYTKLLERTPRTPETRRARVVLWRALEGLYANALADADSARTAAQVAASIEAGAPAPAHG